MTENIRTILVTGASGNLGTSVVEHLLGSGFGVIAVVRSAESGKELRQHENLRVVVLDLLDEKAAAEMIRTSFDETPVDGALLLAGGYAPGTVEDTPLAAIREQVSLNFETAYNIARPLFSRMMERGSGRLVLIGSKPALEPVSGKSSFAYALSKSMLSGLASMLNAEARRSGVVTAVVAPGTIDTPANRRAMPDADFAGWVTPKALAALFEYILSAEAGALRDPVFKMYGGS